MKKTLSALLSAILLLLFCACASEQPPVDCGSDTAPQSKSESVAEETDSGNTELPDTQPVIIDVTNIFSPSTASSGYLDGNGSTVASDVYSHSAAIDAAEGDTIYISGVDKATAIPVVCAFDENSQLLRTFIFAELSFVFAFESGKYTVKLILPENTASIVINIDSRYLAHTLVTKNEQFSAESYDKWYFSSLSDGENLWNIMGSAELSGYIPVKSGDKLYIAAYRNSPHIQQSNIGATFLGSFQKKTDIKSSSVRLEYMINDCYGVYSYTVPMYVDYVRIGPYKTVGERTYISKNKPIEKDDYLTFSGYGYADVDTSNPLYGKTALFLGDSITFGTGEDNGLYGSWASRLAAKYGMTVVNAGDPGARVSQTGPSGFIIDGLDKWTGEQAPDMIVMHGGVNDAINEIAIGQISADGNFDVETFAGGLEAMFKQAKEAYPTSALFYITNYHLDGNNRGNAKDMSGYFDVAKQICEKYGVTVIDLYGNEELNSILETTTKKYLPDLLHANSAAYDIILPYISTVIENYYKSN